MFLDLKQLFDLVGSSKEVNYAFDFSNVSLFQKNPFQSPVQVVGKVFNQAGVVYLEMQILGEMHLICDRCLDAFSYPLNLHIEHLLTKKPLETYDDFILIENNRLELEELVLSDIQLSLPTKILCREDCKGLCQTCGANLNQTSCSCNVESQMKEVL